MLLRFVRGYVNEADWKAKAKEVIGACLAWRKATRVDELAATHFPRKAEFLTMWPHGFHGTHARQPAASLESPLCPHPPALVVPPLSPRPSPHPVSSLPPPLPPPRPSLAPAQA